MFGSFAPWLITACALKPLSKNYDTWQTNWLTPYTKHTSVLEIMLHLKIRKSTHLWVDNYLLQKSSPSYQTDIVCLLGLGLNKWKLVWHVPQGSNWHPATDQLRCMHCIVNLKQPSNKSFIPFQKSEINKWDTDDYDQEVWKSSKLLECFP